MRFLGTARWEGGLASHQVLVIAKLLIRQLVSSGGASWRGQQGSAVAWVWFSPLRDETRCTLHFQKQPHQNNPSPSPICMLSHFWGPKWAFWGLWTCFLISRSWQSCSPPAGAAGKPWKRVVMQERQRPAGRKDHRSGGNIFSLSARLLAGFPPRAAEPPADPSPIRRGDRHSRRLLHGRGWDFGNPSGVPPHAPAQPQPYETSANPRQQGAKELGEKSGLGIC